MQYIYIYNIFILYIIYLYYAIYLCIASRAIDIDVFAFRFFFNEYLEFIGIIIRAIISLLSLIISLEVNIS